LRQSLILGSDGKLWLVGNYKSEKAFKKDNKQEEELSKQMQKDQDFSKLLQDQAEQSGGKKGKGAKGNKGKRKNSDVHSPSREMHGG